MRTIKSKTEAESVIREMSKAINAAKAEKMDKYFTVHIIGKDVAEVFERVPYKKNISYDKPYIVNGQELTQKCFEGVKPIPTFELTFSVDFRWEDTERNEPKIRISPFSYVIAYKDLFLGYRFEQRGKIRLYDFCNTDAWRNLKDFELKAPNLIGTMTPKKLEAWYQYIVAANNHAAGVVNEIAEKKRAFREEYEKFSDVHWFDESHLQGTITRNGIRHEFSINSQGYISRKNVLVAYDGSLETFLQLSTGTYKK
ncbi:hypothetical protein [Bacteroides pyogenes]|uniref:hypothetical protein n=1 Tax=Bacteroides pyogenes TaxID=310300 RepID=UPI002FDA2048